MADNVAVTEGAGKTIAAENISNVLYQRIKLIDPTTASVAAIGVSANPLWVKTGGASKTAVAAGTTSADSVVSAAAGRLYKIIVIATGSAAVSIYDNATASTGTVLFTVPANAATGTIYNVELPVSAGITVGKVNNSPAMLLTYD
mgnify:CR=1 FL=1